MIEESLARIGINKTESRVYLQLLGLGAQPVSVIAKQTSVNRTTAYSILKSLMTKGLIACINKNGINYFSANDPNCILSLFENKAKSFDYYRSQISHLIPKIRNLNKNFNYDKPSIEYREGLESLRYILFNALNTSPFVYMFLPFDFCIPKIIEEFIEKAIDTEKNIKIIAPDTKQSRAFFIKLYSDFFKKEHIIFLNNKDFGTIFASSVNIYNDMLIMFNFETNCEYAVSIHSKELLVIQKNIFSLVWKLNKNDSNH